MSIKPKVVHCATHTGVKINLHIRKTKEESKALLFNQQQTSKPYSVIKSEMRTAVKQF